MGFSELHKSGDEGEPLARVPHGQTVHWTVWPTLLSLWDAGVFRPLRRTTRGPRPQDPRKLWKKLEQNFQV